MVTSIIKQRKSVIPLDPVLEQSVVLLNPVKLKKQFEHIASEHSRTFANITLSPPPPDLTTWDLPHDRMTRTLYISSSEMFERISLSASESSVLKYMHGKNRD